MQRSALMHMAEMLLFFQLILHRDIRCTYNKLTVYHLLLPGVFQDTGTSHDHEAVGLLH